MDHSLLDRVQRRAAEVSSQATRLQQRSARLRAHSAELTTRLTDLQQVVARRLEEMARHRAGRHAQEPERDTGRPAEPRP